MKLYPLAICLFSKDPRTFDLSMKTNFASQISMCDLSRNWDYEIDDELMADLVQGFH